MSVCIVCRLRSEELESILNGELRDTACLRTPNNLMDRRISDYARAAQVRIESRGAFKSVASHRIDPKTGIAGDLSQQRDRNTLFGPMLEN